MDVFPLRPAADVAFPDVTVSCDIPKVAILTIYTFLATFQRKGQD